MDNKGLIDPKPLKELLIQLKGEALKNEARTTGPTKAIMTIRIKDLDALLIYLSTQMEEKDTMALKLRLEEPIPTAVIKAKDKESHELTEALIAFSKQVPEGQSRKISGLEGLKPRSVASKMWALRERGVLPAHIVPLEVTNPQTKQKDIYVSHKTPEELARMRKGRKAASKN